MTSRSPRRLTALSLFLACVLAWIGTPATLSASEDFAPFEPTEQQSAASRALAMRLERVHYLGLPVDDELSERVFQNYIDFLDPVRAFLLASDMEAFEDWRTELDDALRVGDLTPAFTIFNRYHERQLDRLAWQDELLREGLDSLPLDEGATLDLDREGAPFAASEAELDDFWRRRIASQVLGLELAGQTREEALETLLERNGEQVRRASQYHGRDVFQFFMTSLTNAYDPHTQYMVPRVAETFDMNMSLSFEGIGALLRPDGEYARIERIITAGPAEKNGELQPGDRIVGVAQGKDGPVVDITGWRLDDAVQLIRGPRGSLVRLSVLAADAPESAPPRTIIITRDEVKLEEQAARSSLLEMGEDDRVRRIDESGEPIQDPDEQADFIAMKNSVGEAVRIGVIDLPTFYMDTAAAQAGDPDFKSTTRDVAKLLAGMQDEGVEGVILDLRGNGGGSLMEAHELAGLVLGGRPVVQVRESDGNVQILKGSPPAIWKGPLVVLVDRLSASASEIVAAAIQDQRRGLVIGGRTFGKGTVQAVTSAADGRLLVTIAKFYRVTGESTQHRGVLPDIEFPATHDPELVGESSMEGALEWDVIGSLRLQNRPRVESLVPDLTPRLEKKHRARVATDPDFRRLEKEVELLREVSADTVVSLDLETRRSEQEEYDGRRRAIIDEWRVARGYPPMPPEEDDEGAAEGTEGASDEAGSGLGTDPDAADELDEDSPEARALRGPRRVDAWLQEAARILVDAIEDGYTGV